MKLNNLKIGTHLRLGLSGLAIGVLAWRQTYLLSLQTTRFAVMEEEL